MKKIMIICQCATNKGDRAIAEYLIERLSKEDVSITLSTTAPELWDLSDHKNITVMGTGYNRLFPETKNRILNKLFHEIANFYYQHFVYPELYGNRSLKRCEKISNPFIKALADSDTVIVTGGHHITSIRNKNALFAITYDIALASYYSKRYILWSQTIGPLKFDNNKIKQLFSNIIQKAEAVFIRDENSKKCLAQLVDGEQNNVYKTYDSVFGFGSHEFPPLCERENKIGISIFNGLAKSFDTYPAIAKVLDYFVRLGYAVEFFRMEHNSKETADIQTVIDLMETTADIKIFPFQSDTQSHLKEMSTCKYFIGYKTHSVIMALTTATPLLGICYHQKTRDFMVDYSLGEYSIDDTVFNSDAGISLAEKIIKNSEDIHNIMSKKSKSIALSIMRDLEGVENNEYAKHEK